MYLCYMDFKQMQADRFKFLHKICGTIQAQTNYPIDGCEIGQLLGFVKNYSTSIYQYLKDEGLVKPMGAVIRLGIAHWGIKEVKAALKMPDRPTEHFYLLLTLFMQEL